MFMWQQRNLTAPPVCTFKHNLDEGKSGILKNARRILDNETKATHIYETLGCEIFVVKKVAIKSKFALRNEKALQGLKQLERSLRRLVDIRPSTLMNPLLENWPSLLNLHHGAVVYLPSRQILEFVLVRTVGCIALLHQICNRAVLTYAAAMDQIEIGMQMKPMFVFAAAASRIWYLCRALKFQLIELYSHLLPLLDVLQATKAIWLKDGFEFPVDLTAWLGKETGIQLNKRITEVAIGDDSIGTALRQLRHGENREPGTRADPVPNIIGDLALEDVGEEVQRDSLSKLRDARLNQDVSEETWQDKKSVSGVKKDSARQTALPEKSLTQFSEKIWFEKVKLCKNKQELEDLIKAFQKEYDIKSKKCKECCRNLRDSDEKGKLKAHRVEVRKCLKLVGKRIQQRERCLVTVEDDMATNKRRKKIDGSKSKVGEMETGDDNVLKSPASIKAQLSPENSSQFLSHLSLKLLRPRGIIETLAEMKQGCILTGDTSWEIPAKTLPRMKTILRKCRKGLKENDKQKRNDIIGKTVKQLKSTLVANSGQVPANILSIDSGKTEKAGPKRRIKRKGKLKSVSPRNVRSKKDKPKAETGNRFPKQNKDNTKKNKKKQKTEKTMLTTMAKKGVKRGDQNNNAKRRVRQNKNQRKDV